MKVYPDANGAYPSLQKKQEGGILERMAKPGSTLSPIKYELHHLYKVT